MHDGGSTFLRIAALEDAAAHEYTFGTELHHQRCIGRSRHTTGCEVHHRQFAILVHILHQFVGSLQLLGSLEEFVFAHADQATDFALHQSHVTHGLHHVTSAWLTLRANHCGTFGDASQGLAQILRTAYEGHVEFRLVDVVDVVGRTEHLALVDVVNLDSLQDLCLGDMTDAALRHHGDAHSLLDATNHLRVAHS